MSEERKWHDPEVEDCPECESPGQSHYMMCSQHEFNHSRGNEMNDHQLKEIVERACREADETGVAYPHRLRPIITRACELAYEKGFEDGKNDNAQ